MARSVRRRRPLTAGCVALAVAASVAGLAAPPPASAVVMPTAVDMASAAGIAQLTFTWSAPVGDFNGDGWPDFLLSRHGTLPAQIWVNDQQGHFAVAPNAPFPTKDRHGCAIADFNSDGRLDAFCSIGAKVGTAVKANELWLQQPDGSFVNQVASAGVMDPYGRGRHVAIIDANNDGLPDLFVGNSPERIDSIPSPNRLFINMGGGRLRDAPDFGLNREVGSSCAVAADYNGDGLQDLLLCPENGGQLELWQNQSGSGFADVSASAEVAGVARDAKFTDLNGDGRPDIVEVEPTQLVVRLQDPATATFQPAYSLPLVDGVAVASGDVNGDGTVDLYVVQGRGATSSNQPDLILLNDGTGSSFVQLPIPETTLGDGDGVSALDYDQNGFTDFLVLNGAETNGPIQLIAFFPTSSATPAPTLPVGVSTSPRSRSPSPYELPNSAGSASCSPSWSGSKGVTPPGGKNLAEDVVGDASGNAWLVGTYVASGSFRSLAERWDGSAWAIVPTPSSGVGDDIFTAFAEASGNDAWAVGEHGVGTRFNTLVEHWDGASWTVVPSPNTGVGSNLLVGAAAVSSGDAWAVGYSQGADGHVPLALHWNGTEWRLAAPAMPSGGWTADNALMAVEASSPSDVWAVGYRSGVNGYRTLVEHWDGTVWTIVPSPDTGTIASGEGDNVLLAVSAAGPNDLWAVGYSYSIAATAYRPLALHWDGGQWTIVPIPSPTAGPSMLRGVAALSNSDVWAVGTKSEGAYGALAENFDGSSWSAASTGDAPGDDELVAATVNGSEYWAAGATSGDLLLERLCPISVDALGFSPTTVTVSEGNTVSWIVPASEVLAHQIVDQPALGLIDSGPRQPGGSFSYTFVTAGTYVVLDTATGNTGSVQVSPIVKPKRGNIATSFSITVASATPPTGFVLDLQVKRPGAAWAALLAGTTASAFSFTPDVGIGKYSFRARIRNASTSVSSSWSPKKTINVGS